MKWKQIGKFIDEASSWIRQQNVAEILSRIKTQNQNSNQSLLLVHEILNPNEDFCKMSVMINEALTTQELKCTPKKCRGGRKM